MPFRSKSQMKKFFAMESRGELKKGTAEKWAHETPNIKSLPNRLKKKALGGEVGYNKGGKIKKMSRYKMADGGGVPPGGVKRVGTGEKKPGLTPYKGTGDYAPKTTIKGKGVESTSKVYVDDVHSKEYRDKLREAWQKSHAPQPIRRTIKVNIVAPTPEPELENEADKNKKNGGVVKEDAAEIRMPKKKFFSEHKRLIEKLKSGTAKERKEEAAEQKEEVEEYKTGEAKKDGGEVKGKGTETSDSVPAKIKKGSFVIPAHMKNKLKRLLTSKPAKLRQGGGVPVNLSKGEQILAPNDARKLHKEMIRNGIKQGLNIMAPHAKRKYRVR